MNIRTHMTSLYWKVWGSFLLMVATPWTALVLCVPSWLRIMWGGLCDYLKCKIQWRGQEEQTSGPKNRLFLWSLALICLNSGVFFNPNEYNLIKDNYSFFLKEVIQFMKIMGKGLLKENLYSISDHLTFFFKFKHTHIPFVFPYVLFCNQS